MDKAKQDVFHEEVLDEALAKVRGQLFGIDAVAFATIELSALAAYIGELEARENALTGWLQKTLAFVYATAFVTWVDLPSWIGSAEKVTKRKVGRG